MITIYIDGKPKKGVKSPLKNVFMSATYSEIFQDGEAPNFDIFPSTVFPAELF